MNIEEIKLKYAVDAVTTFDKRPFQIFLNGSSKPFFSSDNEQRFIEQIKRIEKLIDEGKGMAYVAYKNGKPYSGTNRVQVAISREYAKRKK